MKVIFAYAVQSEIEVPEEMVKTILNCKTDCIDKGELFYSLANQYGAVPDVCAQGPNFDFEITGVYNPDCDENDLDEILWE